MSTVKTEVYSTFDTTFGTWNVMNMANQCVFFGSIDQLEKWLEDHKDTYQETLH